MDEAPFVERRFELDGHELLVRFHALGKTPGGEYQCRFTIPWPEGEERRQHPGTQISRLKPAGTPAGN